MMAVFTRDTFTDTDATLLQNHTGEGGASWTKVFGYTQDAEIAANACRCAGDQTNARYYASGVPGVPDYIVQADITIVFLAAENSYAGVLARTNPSASDETYYTAFADPGTTNTIWNLYKIVSGTATELGTFTEANSNRQLRLRAVGTAISTLLDEVERISVTDSAITAAGRAGILVFDKDGSTVDNLTADDFTRVPEGGGAFSPFQLWLEEELL